MTHGRTVFARVMEFPSDRACDPRRRDPRCHVRKWKRVGRSGGTYLLGTWAGGRGRRRPRCTRWEHTTGDILWRATEGDPARALVRHMHQHRGMARALRIEFAGAFYHVTSRGNEGQPIYRDDADHLRALAILADVAERFHLLLHGYVLMDNHYVCAAAHR